MKVLILSNNLTGILAFRMEVIKALIKNGYEVILAIPLQDGERFDILYKLGCMYIPLPLKRHSTNPFEEIKLFYTFKKIVKKVKPDIALTYTIKPNIYGSLACRKCGIPVVANITGLGNALVKPGLLQKITIELYRWAFKNTKYVFFQNEAGIDFFLKHKIHLNKYKCIWGSGVNLNKFKFSEYPSDKNGIHFVFIGRIFKEKGIEHYLDAAATLKMKYDTLHFHILGDFDDVNLSNLIKKMHQEGIVEYHGKQSDVIPFLEQYHCVVHPSFYSEGMSNVLQEGAAIGRPAITTDKEGCKEVVDDGITGYIVKQKDSSDLIEKLESFILLPFDEKAKMGRAARIKVERQFDRKNVVKAYLDAINFSICK